MTNCETTGSVAPSTVTPTAALSAVKLLARPCIVSATLPAADASAKTIVALTLTLAALTLRLMSAGDTLREAPRLDLKLAWSKSSTVPCTVSCISTCVNVTAPGIDGGDGGGNGQNAHVPAHILKKGSRSLLHLSFFALLSGNSRWQKAGSASPQGDGVGCGERGGGEGGGGGGEGGGEGLGEGGGGGLGEGGGGGGIQTL